MIPPERPSAAAECDPRVFPHIRPIAIGIFRRGDDIFVFEGADPSTGESFCRPLGGGIEFGEYGHDALAREIREELGAEIEDVCYLATLENVFTYNGRPHHQIVQVYEARFADPSLHEQARVTGHEDDGTTFEGVWKSLHVFRSGQVPLYPKGLLKMLDGSDGDAGIVRRGDDGGAGDLH